MNHLDEIKVKARAQAAEHKFDKMREEHLIEMKAKNSMALAETYLSQYKDDNPLIKEVRVEQLRNLDEIKNKVEDDYIRELTTLFFAMNDLVAKYDKKDDDSDRVSKVTQFIFVGNQHQEKVLNPHIMEASNIREIAYGNNTND